MPNFQIELLSYATCLCTMDLAVSPILRQYCFACQTFNSAKSSWLFHFSYILRTPWSLKLYLFCNAIWIVIPYSLWSIRFAKFQVSQTRAFHQREGEQSETEARPVHNFHYFPLMVCESDLAILPTWPSISHIVGLTQTQLKISVTQKIRVKSNKEEGWFIVP